MSSLPYSPIKKQPLSRRLPQIGTAISLCALVGFFGFEVSTSPIFRVQNVTITGNAKASDVAIRHLGNIRFNEHLALINPESIAAQIEQHPWIQEATVSRAFPSGVQIDITEYEPTLLLALDRMWYVGEHGTIFRAADNFDMNHPILTGIDPTWIEDHPNIVQKVIQDALTIRTAFDLPLIGSEDNISEIHFQRETGFQVILRNGTTIALGFYDPDSRVKRLRHMVSKGLDLSNPQIIELDAEQVAITKPLSQL